MVKPPLELEIPDMPLDTEGLGGYRPKSFPRIPSEMVDSIALGMEDDLVVAARHGFSVEEYREIEKLKPFQVAVQTRRAEYEKTGITTRLKSGMLADMALDKLAVLALSDGATFNQVHEALKTFARLGGLEPKEEKNTQGPNLPTIVINAGGAVSMKPAPLVEIVPPKALPDTDE